MRLALITLSLALLLLLMHLILFRFLPGNEVIDLPFLSHFDLPLLFVSPPPLPNAPTTPTAQPRTPTGAPATTTFHGPTGEPSVRGPSAPPPNY